MANNIHDKHRERMRNEFLAFGIDHRTPEHKVLEMLLFYCIPRKDTNVLAHELINKFGSFSAVLDASPRELMQVKGIGERSAMFLKMIMPVARFYNSSKQGEAKEYDSFDALHRDIADLYSGYTNEVCSIVSLDNSFKRLGFDIICEGDLGKVGISVRDVVEIILKRKATAVVLVHNHPSGSAIPSPEDITATEILSKSLASLGVKLIDHLIVVPDDYVSLAVSHQFQYLFKR